MKYFLISMVVCLLVSAEAAAQQSPPTAALPPPDPVEQLRQSCNIGTATHTAYYKETVLITGWTGGCKNGRRDGFGILSWNSLSYEPFSNEEGVIVESGNYVDGLQVGLWCRSTDDVTSTSRNQNGLYTSRRSSPLGCLFKFGPVPSNYRLVKEADARWTLINAYDGVRVNPDTHFQAGALEGLSADLVALVARRGILAREGAPTIVPAESKALGDLIEGGRFFWDVGNERRPDLRSSSIAVVLSSRAVAEGDRLRNDVQKLLASPANKAPSDKKQRAAWELQQKALHSVDTSSILRSVTNVTIPYVKSLQPANDLSVLQTGAADYALVVDWTYDGNIVMDQKQYLALPACVRDEQKCSRFFTPHMTVYLIDKNLHVRTSHMDAIGAARGNGVSYEDYKRAPPMEWLRGHLINTIEEIGGLAEYIWESQIQQRPSAQP